MRSFPGRAEPVQMARIARRYYLEGRSKRDIAAELGLSRFQVARNLRKARDSGLVRMQECPATANARAVRQSMRAEVGPPPGHGPSPHPMSPTGGLAEHRLLNHGWRTD